MRIATMVNVSLVNQTVFFHIVHAHAEGGGEKYACACTIRKNTVWFTRLGVYKYVNIPVSRTAASKDL